jgi:hypothetical protein
MKKLLVLFLALGLFTGPAFADSNNSVSDPPLPITDGAGGPDAYGYYWEDNDNGGNVPYEWFELSGIGTEVEGLSDDNNVGPFPLGFNFPYYWYEVDHCWIGSNGYISFSSNYNFSHPFSGIPNPGYSNDLLAPLTGDLSFVDYNGNPYPDAKCYYWTNNTDSFAVQYTTVPEFANPDSIHTFQVVLDATDSSITYYYGVQRGIFYAPGHGSKMVIGMEDITGTIGLEYLHDLLPSKNMFHDSLALRFHPEPSDTFEFHDIGTDAVFNEGNQAKLQSIDNLTIVGAFIKNYGTEPENDFEVECKIKDPDNNTVYRDTISITTVLDAGQKRWAYFAPFTPTMEGQYSVDVRTLLSDRIVSNNTMRAELRVIDFQGGSSPVDLLYDDGTADDGRSWNRDSSGFGQEFESPYLPMQVHNVQVNVFNAGPGGNMVVWLMDDDGTGNPGEILAASTIMVNQSGWHTIDFSSHNITITEGKVFAMAVHETQGTFTFAMDQTATLPFSYRGWQYIGGLTPDRDREESDIMIRISATVTPTAVEIEIVPDNPPVVVNPGGSFTFTGILTNNSDENQVVDVAVYLDVPGCGCYGPIKRYNNIPLSAYQTITVNNIVQEVPAYAPLGEYRYRAFCGEFPHNRIDSASFDFTVVTPISGNAGDWDLSGWFDDAEEQTNALPIVFALSGNYPNPFNSETTIDYQLPINCEVKLVIYNLLGQKVETLVDGLMEAGHHSVQWDASAYSSGIYFYKLNAGDKIFTRRMTLLK